MNLVLASGSPRRHDLLSMAAISHIVVPADREERSPWPNENAGDYAMCLARQKADQVARKYGDCFVLGADTVVVDGKDILGKPESELDARRMLSSLRGKEHAVVTAIALVSPLQTLTHRTWARVRMRRFSDTQIQTYVASGEPTDKAGAYAIQGRGSDLTESVEGCYFTVVGLPLCDTVALLRASGLATRQRNWCSYCENRLD